MANAEQLAILKRGAKVWNKWRDEYPNAQVDLSLAILNRANLEGANLGYANLSRIRLRKADLRNAYLDKADLSRADLWGTDFSEASLLEANLQQATLSGCRLINANLIRADLTAADLPGSNLNGARLTRSRLTDASLSGASLSRADLRDASLNRVDFREADLSGANLSGANLSGANLSRADLTGAWLVRAILIGAKIDKAKVSRSLIYAVNVWDLEGQLAEQKDMIITRPDAPIITVDNIKVAQFIYLILNNEEIRDVINTLTSKTVLILGRFADEERKAILDALRNKLREYNLLPIVFDFDRPIDRNITETIKTLAAISYFVIADVTSPKSSPLELQAIVPDFQIPVVPIIQEEELPFSMITDLQSQHNGVLDPLTYQSEETLIKALKAAVIDPAIEKHHELRLIKAQKRKIRHAEDFIDDKGLDSLSDSIE